MMSARRRAELLVLALGLGGCVDADGPLQPAAPPTVDARSGGAMTIFDATSGAFSRPAPNLSSARLALHQQGDAAFEAVFVPAPAPVNAGLGPRFDNVSCSGCHAGDGRGRPPLGSEPFNSMLFRVSVPGIGPHGGPNPAGSYGTQLELQASVGLTPMATIGIAYRDSSGTFSDGTPWSLRVPAYTIGNPYEPLPAGLMLSPRVAPPIVGLGLLEAVPEATLLGLAESQRGDGVSGKANCVWDAAAGRVAMGRFGQKANTPSILQQVAAAYQADMGITSSLFPDEPCQDPMPGCAVHPPEINDSVLAATAHYVRTLGVPARRSLSDPGVQRGEQLFATAGCTRCHVPTLATGSVPDGPEVSGQTIHPYTDLLLHEMGPGLADNRPDFLASGSQWRTAPLWGIGLTALVNGHTNFLHDGRARDLLEAILWHGGEAANARDRVLAFPKADRDALVAFLGSL